MTPRDPKRERADELLAQHVLYGPQTRRGRVQRRPTTRQEPPTWAVGPALTTAREWNARLDP